RRRDRRVDGVAALLEHAGADRRRDRVRRRDHAVQAERLDRSGPAAIFEAPGAVIQHRVPPPEPCVGPWYRKLPARQQRDRHGRGRGSGGSMAAGVGRVAGKVALVTGARGGIGRATSIALASEGARLVLGDVADLAETAKDVRAAGAADVLTVKLDV